MPTTNEYEKSTNMQVYLAVQYLFYRQLYFKVVGGYAKSHFENLDDRDSLRRRHVQRPRPPDVPLLVSTPR